MARTTRLSVCRRKRRFAGEDDAKAAALAASITLRPYRCDRCFGFHLTGRTRGKRLLASYSSSPRKRGPIS